MRRSLYLALVHHPVRDAQGATVTTAVTNLDVHDIARSCRTYGLERYYVVTPIDAQIALVERILGHWRDGSGGRRIPARAEALRLTRAASSLAHVRQEIRERHAGVEPLTVVTAATPPAGLELSPFSDARAELGADDGRPWLLLFGTGHGLTESVLREAELALAPIRPGGYNHLSVRAAVAIVLDRLIGD